MMNDVVADKLITEMCVCVCVCVCVLNVYIFCVYRTSLQTVCHVRNDDEEEDYSCYCSSGATTIKVDHAA